MNYPILPNACSPRGAAMGRCNEINEPDSHIKFHLYRMPMSPCGAYDSGGAYWGCGGPTHGWMYHAYGEGPDHNNEMFIRARSRNHAKELVREEFENARFYR